MSPGWWWQFQAAEAIKVLVNTRISARAAVGASVWIAVARGCSPPAGCAAIGACARHRARWSMGHASAASRGFSTTAPVTTRTRVPTSPSRAHRPAAASAGPPCPSSPCSSPASCATSRLKDVSPCASAAMTESPDPAVVARTRNQSTVSMLASRRRQDG